MTPDTVFSELVRPETVPTSGGERNKGWHEDSLPRAVFLHNSVPLIPLGRKTIPRQRLGSRRADAHRPRLTSLSQTHEAHQSVTGPRGVLGSWPPSYCIVARDTLADVLGQVELRTKSCPVEKLFY